MMLSSPAHRFRMLMTTDAVGGVWSYALELAGGLSRAGVSTVLAVLGPAPDAGQRAMAAAIPDLRLEHRDCRLEWMPAAAGDVLRAGDWLLGLERRYRPDLVQVNGFAHAALPWRAPCLLVAHSCVRSWWQSVHGGEPPAEYDEYLRGLRQGLRQAAAVVAPTAAFLAELERLYGPLPHGRAIMNGRDAPAEPKSGKRRLVLAAGRAWDAAKNIGALDAAALDVAWPVLLAGSHRGPGGVAPAFANLRCLGPLDARAMADWLAAAAIFAAPARYEPFGLAILEAALARCALVLGDIAPLRELWGGTAVFVPPDDERALAQALRILTEDPARLQVLAAAAQRRARLYSARRMTEAYLALYRSLLASPAHMPRRPAGRQASPSIH